MKIVLLLSESIRQIVTVHYQKFQTKKEWTRSN